MASHVGQHAMKLGTSLCWLSLIASIACNDGSRSQAAYAAGSAAEAGGNAMSGAGSTPNAGAATVDGSVSDAGANAQDGGHRDAGVLQTAACQGGMFYESLYDELVVEL